MTDMERTIEDGDIYWAMSDARAVQPGTAPKLHFEAGNALALMLLNEVIFTNSYWCKVSELGAWDAEKRTCAMIPIPDARWTEEEASMISMHVGCNDVFAWGCADAEDLPESEIRNLYDMWRKDPDWGAAVWCCTKRKEFPQKPVEKEIRTAGIWNLDDLGLAENYGTKYDREKAEAGK